MEHFLHYCDLLGTFAFALSGATSAVRRNFDIFGVFVLSMITAIGGGVLRDLCIAATPPAGLVNNEYLVLIFSAVICVAFFQRYILSFNKATLFFDAVGLGFFAAFGADKTYQYTGNIVLSISLGCVSAVGGGCIRDVFVGKSPSIFSQDIYASAAIVGSCIQLFGSTNIIPPQYSICLSISVCLLIRLIALRYNISMPSIKQRDM